MPRDSSSGRSARAYRAMRRLCGIARDEAGATMVEFALVALPFFLLLFGTFEIGFVYWANQELENATTHGARLVRTGQVQTNNISQAQLKTEICSKTAILVGCGTRLRLDVRSARTFAELSAPQPTTPAGALKNDGDFAFSPGGANDVVIVTAFYSWTPFLKPSDYILRAASITRNEPF